MREREREERGRVRFEERKRKREGEGTNDARSIARSEGKKDASVSRDWRLRKEQSGRRKTHSTTGDTELDERRVGRDGFGVKSSSVLSEEERDVSRVGALHDELQSERTKIGSQLE